MNTIAALIVLDGYLASGRRLLHERVASGGPEAGAATLEALIWAVGLILLATAAIAVITVAVNRRLEQIN